MAFTNKIHEATAGGLALQVTNPAREAELVMGEGSDKDAQRAYKADVYVYGFEGILLVIDADKVSDSDRADLVAAAIDETGSIYQGGRASVTVSGNPGYKVQLPGCTAAGFHEGDYPQVRTAQGVLVIHDEREPRAAQVVASKRRSKTDGGQDTE